MCVCVCVCVCVCARVRVCMCVCVFSHNKYIPIFTQTRHSYDTPVTEILFVVYLFAAIFALKVKARWPVHTWQLSELSWAVCSGQTTVAVCKLFIVRG